MNARVWALEFAIARIAEDRNLLLKEKVGAGRRRAAIGDGVTKLNGIIRELAEIVCELNPNDRLGDG